MSINPGRSAFPSDNQKPFEGTENFDPGNGGGNSGAVLSPAPGLGLSAYQDPRVPVKAPLPNRQGGS